MTEGIPSISSIISQLPHKLQIRFESLGSYVRGLIAEESIRLGTNIVFSTQNIQLIQLAALIYSLDSFFRAGSSSARTAATVFEQFDLSGFQVGLTTFTRSNHNTRRGEILASRLQETIVNSYLGTVIKNSSTMKDLISRMIREMNNG
jgi:hypothetical protein